MKGKSNMRNGSMKVLKADEWEEAQRGRYSGKGVIEGGVQFVWISEEGLWG